MRQNRPRHEWGWEVGREPGDGPEGRGEHRKGEGRGGGELYHPARLLLAGGFVFWHHRWGVAKLGVGVGDHHPGVGEGPLVGGEVTGVVGAGVGNTGLSAAGGSGAGGDEVAGLPAERTKVVVCPAAALVKVEGPLDTSRTIQIHRASTGGRVLGWGEGVAAGVVVLLPLRLLLLLLLMLLRLGLARC